MMTLSYDNYIILSQIMIVNSPTMVCPTMVFASTSPHFQKKKYVNPSPTKLKSELKQDSANAQKASSIFDFYRYILPIPLLKAELID